MAVTATVNTDPLTITPSKVRYSLLLECFGEAKRGMLFLQRSEKKPDGTWLDDPRPDARRRVELPDVPALDGITALVPTILERLGVKGKPTEYRLHVDGRLSEAGALVVSVVIQARVGQKWFSKMIPSLDGFLAEDKKLAASVLAAWDAMDAAVDKANAREGWV